MKIYISGRISGLSLPEVKNRFQEAQDFLEGLGLEVINPTKNGLTESHTWEQHMVRDIELLLECEAIYMFDGWQDSVGASIEYDIAIRTGKDVWFELHVVKKQSVVLKIQNAIHEVTGMKFAEYTTKSRKRKVFFARMLFVYHCHKNNISPMRYIHRDRTMMPYYLTQYSNDIKFNAHFRGWAQKVDNILNRANNET